MSFLLYYSVFHQSLCQRRSNDSVICMSAYRFRLRCYRYPQAKVDAEGAVALKPDWIKPHARLAAAYAGMRQLDEAAASYGTCLKLAPGNKQYMGALHDIEVSWPAFAWLLELHSSATLHCSTAQSEINDTWASSISKLMLYSFSGILVLLCARTR